MPSKLSSVTAKAVFDLRPSIDSVYRCSLLVLRLATAVLLLSACLEAAAQINFGTVNIGASATSTVTISIPTASTLTAINVFTQGAPNLDFTNGGGGTCSTGKVYAANTTCTVNVAFAPIYPGTRYGAVVLASSSGVIATAYLEGTGVGPMVGFLPGNLTEVGDSSGAPRSVAVDGSGNVYVADLYFNHVFRETPSAGGYTQSTVPTSTLSTPAGIALDGSGNLYIADSGNGRVLMETPSAGSYTESTVASGLSDPCAVAVDGGGNVYIAVSCDYVQSYPAVLKETLAAGTYTQSAEIDVRFSASLSYSTSTIAVDGNGNVYVAGNTSPPYFEGVGVLNKFSPNSSGGGYSRTTIGNGFSNPTGLAVDGNGNIYVADAGQGVPGAMLLESLSNGQYTQSLVFYSIGFGIGDPTGVALDGSGNLLIAANGAWKYELSTPPTLNFADTAFGAISSDSPSTITVSNHGNFPLTISGLSFATDFPESNSIATECTPGISLKGLETCTLTINFEPLVALNGQTSLALSENGSVTTNSLNSAADDQAVPVTGIETKPQATLALFESSSPAVLGTPLTFTAVVTGTMRGPIPTGTVTFSWDIPDQGLVGTLGTVNLDGQGVATFTTSSLSVAQYFITASYSGDSIYWPVYQNWLIGIHESIVAAPATATFGDTSIGNVNVGSASSSISVPVTFNSVETLGNIAVLTQGSPNLDFTNAGGGTCAIGVQYAANATCTVNVAFAPRYPGPRYGAVVLSDNNGNVIGTGYLQGAGKAPQAVFVPGSHTMVGNNLSNPSGIAVDGSGNIYLADFYNVYKETLANGVCTQTLLFTKPYEIISLAIDGAGDIYIVAVNNTVNGGNFVYKETPSNGSFVETMIGYGFGNVSGVAVDGSGNVYVADSRGGYLTQTIPAIYKELLSNGSYTQTMIASGFITPNGVAVDGNGNVYVSDAGNSNNIPTVPGAIYMETLLANGSYTQTAIGSGWVEPLSVAVDGNGNIYVTDLANLVLSKLIVSDGGYVQSTITDSCHYRSPATVDGSGNVYFLGSPVCKENLSGPTALSFVNTASGATSTDSPQVVTVSNIGNVSLNFSALSYPADFPEGISGTNDCKSSTVLAANGSCTLTADFTPVAAGTTGSTVALVESVTVTTNTLNVAGTRQLIAVSGTETNATTPAFSIAATSVTLASGATTGNSSTITLTPSGGFTGSITLTAAITNSPAGAQYPPTLSFGSKSTVDITGTTPVTATLTVTTKAATSSAMIYPKRGGVPWYAAGGPALAFVLFCGIPARHRNRRTVFGMLALLVMLAGGVLSCGGGGGGSGGGGGGGTGNPGTTAGSYTITVTGTSGTTTATGTVALTVE